MHHLKELMQKWQVLLSKTIMACHDTLEFTDEELHAVIDESHRNGLPITAHATYDACIEQLNEKARQTLSQASKGVRNEQT